MGTKKRILLLGVDAASLELIKKWADEGALLNFKKLLNHSLFGKLKSTIPYLTPPAWVSSYTGVNPGKHGVFDFIKFDFKNKKRDVVTSEDIKQETFWQILSRYGKICVVANAPLTYPVSKINGLMVSGMLTPSKDSVFVYPKSFKKEILKIIPDYKFGPNWKFLIGENEMRFSNELFEILDQNEKLFWFLWKRLDWDLFFFVFAELDRVEHFFWKDIDKPLEENPIKKYYVRIDKILGEVLKRLKKKDLLIIYSDHGMRKVKKEVLINSLLYKNGFIFFKKTRSWKKGRLKIFSLTADNLSGLLKTANKLGVLTPLVSIFTFFQKKLGLQVPDESINEGDFDWNKTKAWFFSHPGQSIIVNQKFTKSEKR